MSAKGIAIDLPVKTTPPSAERDRIAVKILLDDEGGIGWLTDDQTYSFGPVAYGNLRMDVAKKAGPKLEIALLIGNQVSVYEAEFPRTNHESLCVVAEWKPNGGRPLRPNDVTLHTYGANDEPDVIPPLPTD